MSNVVWQGFAGTPDQPGDYWHDTIIQDLIARIPSWCDINLLVTPGHFRDAKAINEFVGRDDWIVWVLGDEEGDCPFWDVNAPVWKQLANPNRRYWPDRLLPLGYTPNTRPALGDMGVPGEKDGWVFAGQDTNPRRHEAVEALSHLDESRVFPSPTFASGLDHPIYMRKLWESEWAPCPAGNVRADSFRMWEALEAGTIPIVDETSPEGDRNIWPDLLGESPIPSVGDWWDARSVLFTAAPLAEVGAWYTRYKRDLVKRLVDDWGRTWDPPSTRLTTIITASPVPSDPDFSMLAETVESVRARLPNEICIAFDGAREWDHEYEELIRRVAWYANQYWPEVWIHYTGRWKHQAGTLKDVLKVVDSGALLVLEHDTPLTGEIPFDDLVARLYLEEFNHIRLHYDTSIHPEHEYLMRGKVGNYTQTVQYSQRPHVAKTEFYRDLLAIVPGHGRTYVEDCVYGAMANSPWEHNKLGIYTPPGDIQRSYHLDGRAGEPKREFWW